MNKLRVDNYIIEEPLDKILERVKLIISNGKLKDIEIKSDEIVITCPFHADGMEKDPDCHINLTKNKDLPYGFYHCFACGNAGSFEKIIASCFNSSDEYAKEWLIKTYGILAYEKIDIGSNIDLSTKRKTKYIDESILDTYQNWCPYFAKRKLTRETCNKFKVKYDPEHRNVIFPCFDKDGHLIMLPNRNIDSKVFYLDKNVDKPVYCLNYILKNNINKCIITEGPFDCLTGWQYGAPTIATLGTISEQQIAAINKSCILVLYTMFDNDAAGRTFAQKIKNELDPRIIVVELKIPSPYKDINDLDYDTFWKIINENAKI